MGAGVARRLLEGGHEVVVVTRSGRGAGVAGEVPLAVDAADGGAMVRLARGAATVFNCANPPYHRWARDWPPIAASLLEAATQAGAVLATMSNLYQYGPVDGPMTEDLPAAPVGPKGAVRAAMWGDAVGAHRAGRVRAVEVRASDFYGPGLTVGSPLGSRVVPRILAGRPVQLVPGRPDVPHSWTYVDDAAASLVRVAAEPAAWGRPWHVPTNPPQTARRMVEGLAGAAGVATPPVRAMAPGLLRLAGVVSPTVRALDEVAYQFDRPFVIDSGAMSATFGMEPTPLDETLAATVAWWQRAGRPEAVAA